jgi:hypothetical protein
MDIYVRYDCKFPSFHDVKYDCKFLSLHDVKYDCKFRGVSVSTGALWVEVRFLCSKC